MPRLATVPVYPSSTKPQSNALSDNDVRELTRILNRLGVPEPAKSSSFDNANIIPSADVFVRSPRQKAEAIYKERQRRTRFFPKSMLGETGWEILLVLYVHDGLSRLRVKDVGQLIDAPATTILRWLKVLEERGFIAMRKHHLDGRVTILDLTAEGRGLFNTYFNDEID